MVVKKDVPSRAGGVAMSLSIALKIVRESWLQSAVLGERRGWGVTSKCSAWGERRTRRRRRRRRRREKDEELDKHH